MPDLQERNTLAGIACIGLVNTINATGGIRADAKGAPAPQADPDWLDIAYTYLRACTALGIAPLFADDPQLQEKQKKIEELIPAKGLTATGEPFRYGQESQSLEEATDALMPVCRELIQDINSLGGIILDGKGGCHPPGSPEGEEWTDIGAVYLDACKALQAEPLIHNPDEE